MAGTAPDLEHAAMGEVRALIRKDTEDLFSLPRTRRAVEHRIGMLPRESILQP
jgi:hypothetical protein